MAEEKKFFPAIYFLNKILIVAKIPITVKTIQILFS
jgi:hypothetical protein